MAKNILNNLEAIDKRLSDLSDEISKMKKNYNDLLSNIDDDCLSSSLLRQKSKFTKLYNSFDSSIEGYTFNGDLRTETDDGVGIEVSGTNIKIFTDNQNYQDIFLGSVSNIPVLIFGNGVEDENGKTSGQMILEKHSDESESYALVRYITKSGHNLYIKFSDTGITFYGGKVDFSNVEVTGLPVQSSPEENIT